MGRRSKIGVRFDEDERNTGAGEKDAALKMHVSGHVEILSREEEELPAV